MASHIIVHSLKFFPISCILAIAIYLQPPMASQIIVDSFIVFLIKLYFGKKRLDLQIVYQMKLLNIK
jgi:hypothetical protein